MTYSHEGTHGLEPAASKLVPSVTANGAENGKDGQPMTNHHDCHFLGKQPLFACRDSYYVAAVAVHTKDHTVKGLLADVNFRHGENVYGHVLHGLVRYRSPLGFPHDVPVIGIAGLTDRATLPDLLDGVVKTDLVDLKPALHVQGLLPDPWVHHVVVPSLTQLKYLGLWDQQLTMPVKLAILFSQPLSPLLPVIRVGQSPLLGRKGLRLGVVVGPVVPEA